MQIEQDGEGNTGLLNPEQDTARHLGRGLDVIAFRTAILNSFIRCYLHNACACELIFCRFGELCLDYLYLPVFILSTLFVNYEVNVSIEGP